MTFSTGLAPPVQRQYARLSPRRLRSCRSTRRHRGSAERFRPQPRGGRCSGSTPRESKSCRTESTAPSSSPSGARPRAFCSLPRQGLAAQEPRTASRSFRVASPLSSRVDPRAHWCRNRSARRAAGVSARGVVPEPELVELYRRASCVVFPSLYEGFGAPPLEAMACGTAVAASTSGSLPEVCGEAAVFFDPHDARAIAAGVGEALDRSDVLSALGLARAARFTWSACADGHAEAYCQAANLFQTGLDRAR